MPNSPLVRQPNDLAVREVPPANPSQRRVPTAEAASLDGEIAAHLSRRSRRELGWIERPTIAVTPPRTLVLSGGRALMPIAPDYELPLTGTVEVPAIASSAEVVSRNEQLSLVGFSCEVGAEQDPELGQVTFDALDPLTQAITQQAGENSRRSRFFWAIVLSPSALVASEFYAALPLLASNTSFITPADLESVRRLEIANTTSQGFVIGPYRVFAIDPNWRNAARYRVDPAAIEVLPIATVRRLQNFTERGYTWGNTGEEPLDVSYAIAGAGPIAVDVGNQVRSRIFDLMAGRPGRSRPYGRAVQNFSSGAVIGNPGRIGEAASSPNNSVCLPSPNRVSFTNEAYLETLAIAKLTAGNDGNGNALLTVPLESCPTGSRFSEVAANHKIYATNGEEIGSFGRFQNLGGVGALTWIADANQKILPGQVAYFAPAVAIPAGSGMSVPFTAIEQVWIGATGQPLSVANIRDGRSADLIAYEAPADSQDFFVVYGPERAAIHAIYRRVEVTADGAGVATIPAGELGCFAFISGVSGRIDKPVVTGLAANTTYQTLVYYPPRQAETWQFQLKFSPYSGMDAIAAATWLNGAQVLGYVFTAIHTQGGGGSIFRSGGDLQFSPIAMHLPIATSATPYYALNALAQLEGEAGQGYVTFRETPFLPTADRSAPSPGQILTVAAATLNHPRSLKARLSVDGRLLGLRVPRLDGDRPGQAIVAFAVEKAGVRRLVVATQTGPGGVAMTLDTDTGCAIGVFDL